MHRACIHKLIHKMYFDTYILNAWRFWEMARVYVLFRYVCKWFCINDTPYYTPLCYQLTTTQRQLIINNYQTFCIVFLMVACAAALQISTPRINII